MTKQEQIAKLALMRASTRCTMVVIATNDQAALIKVIRKLDPRAVLSLVGAGAVRLHGLSWGDRRAARAA